MIDLTANQVEWSNNDGNMTHSTTKEGKKTPLSGKKVHLLLSDALVDLDAPVTVSVNCKSVFRGKVKRSAAVLLRELAARPDPAVAPTAELIVEVP